MDTSPPLYEKLKNERLESIGFNEMITENTNSKLIENIMNKFLSVRPKFGPVAASKLMHMAIPHLFVMWDTGIKAKYRIPTYYAANHAKKYVTFLKLMQQQVKRVIDSYSQTYNVDAQTAVQEIRINDNNSTLPRMIDKYNFAIRDD